MSKHVLSIALDLGSDTLKVAFAYKDGRAGARDVCYGKLYSDETVTRTAIPAVAFYDEDKKKWLYGSEVGASSGRSFVNVVKIKNLLSLLETVPAATEKEEEACAAATMRNIAYYEHDDQFPRFAFPRRKNGRVFSDLVNSRQTFCAAPYTPRAVCEEFFRYAAGVVEKKIAALQKESGCDLSSRQMVLVYPPKAQERYIDEYERLAEKAFGIRPKKRINSIKAMSMYAMHVKAISSGDRFLIFDMGEEDISVAKASLIPDALSFTDRLAVDAAHGHNAPCDIGGNDIDEAVARRIEEFIRVSETPGTPSYGKEGHIEEKTLESKQYLFLKNIKDAKVYLGMCGRDDAYAPIGVHRALFMQSRLTGRDFRRYIGCAERAAAASVAEKICAYIIEELRRPVNRDVNKIILAGGVTETYGLVDHIKKKIARETSAVEVRTLDSDMCGAPGDFAVSAYEDSVYAAAAGAAIMLATGYELKTVLALSYGTWVMAIVGGYSVKRLQLFAEKGEEIRKEYLSEPVKVGSNCYEILGDEILSTPLTRADIERMTDRGESDIFKNTGLGKVMIVGEPGTVQREKAERLAGLKTMTDAKLRFLYRGRNIIVPATLPMCEGIRMDCDGRATPIVGTAGSFKQHKDGADRLHQVRYVSFSGGRYLPEGEAFFAKEKDIVMDSGFKPFDTGMGG